MTLPFANDTSAVTARLARRSIRADRRRNLFVILTIALAAALLSGMFLIAGAQQRQLEDDIRGQYQALVADADQTLIDRLSALPEIEQWGLSQSFGSTRYQDSILYVEYADENWMELGKKPPVEGALPETEQEVIVERAFLDYFGLPQETGQTLKINLDGTEREYVVTGVFQVENASRVFQMQVSRAYLEAHAGGAPRYEFRMRYRGAEQAGNMDALKEEIRTFLMENGVDQNSIFFSSNYFDMQGFQSGSDKYYYPVALLILVACALVIYSIFYISVRGKLREYGRLKVIGATPRQLRQVVRREGLYLSLRGIPLGLAVGGIIAFSANPAYWSWRGNLGYLLAVAVVIELAVLLSTNAPVRMAARVSPIEAVRASAYSTSDAGRGDTRRLSRSITPASLARMNFERSRKKTVMTLISLGLTGVFLVAAATVLDSINVNNMAESQMGDGCNYTIFWNDSVGLEQLPDTERDNPLTDVMREELLTLPEVEAVTARCLVTAEIDLPRKADAFAIHSLDRQRMAELLPEEVLLEGTADYDALVEGNGIVVTDAADNMLDTYWDYTPQIGDRLMLKTYGGRDLEVTVMGIVRGNDEMHNGTGIALFTLPEDLARRMYPDIPNMEVAWNVHTTEDSPALRETIFGLLEDPLLAVNSREDYAAALQGSLSKMIGLVYLLLGFLFLFSLFNLVNTLMTSLISRRQEFGILQSVGMTGRQLSAMLRVECLCYVLATLFLSAAAGGVAGAALVPTLTDLKLFGTLVYRFPTLELAVFAAALLAVWLLYSAVAVRYLHRQSLVERIKTVE